MSQLFTTETMPASDRIDAWRWNAQQICGDCRIQLPKSKFHGSIEVRTVGGLKLTRFCSSPLAFWKWPADMVRSEERPCIVITQLLGHRRYLQNGGSVLLNAGDTTIMDAGRPWCSSCNADCTRLYLRVPRWMMEARLRQREIPIGQRICGRSGLGAALFKLSQCLYDEAERMTEPEGAAALDAYFGILAACIHGVGSNQSKVDLDRGQSGLELRGRIRRYIDTHLSEPALAPEEIALAFRISVRHLHRLFSVTGYTLAAYIRARRLEECRNDLANPRLQDRTITDLAFFWGFSDSAHFSHAFTKEFGLAPREFRAQAASNEARSNQYGRVRDLLRADDASEWRYPKPN